MDLIFRKLQNLGGSLYISLPKQWTENYRLKEKTPVAIEVKADGSLCVLPKQLQDKKEIVNETILESNPYVVRQVVKGILSGQTKITVLSEKEINKSLRNQIRYWVNGLPNTEITEESKQRIVIQNFGYKKIPTKKLIHRLLYIIEDMFEALTHNTLQDLNYSFQQLRKFYFILVMHIRTYLRTGIYVTEDNDFTPLEAMDYRMFCEKIEEIGKILKEVRLNNTLIPFFEEIRQYYKEVMDTYLKQDSKLAYYVWLKKDKLVEKAFDSNKEYSYEDMNKIKNMLRIADLCKDMAALV
jgi:antitoxin component of MazEF toxin-antitoxin module